MQNNIVLQNKIRIQNQNGIQYSDNGIKHATRGLLYAVRYIPLKGEKSYPK